MKEELAQETIKHIKEILKSPIPFGTLVGQMDKVIENYEKSLEEVKECCPHVFNNIDMNPECLKCGSPKQKDWYEDAVGKKLSKHSPKQKEDCCQGKWVHSKDCPVLKQIKQKQEIELPEELEGVPTGTNIGKNRKAINQIIKYLKQ